MDRNNRDNRYSSELIMYSSRDQQVVAEQPRQPRNLQGLLRFAMEATKAEDAPGDSEFEPMDPERRRFLEEALRNMTVNVADILQEAIKVLSDLDKIEGINMDDELPEEVDVAFKNVLEYVDDINMANDFYKLGGFAIFPVCYSSANEKVRSQASRILAELCQNNPYCQGKAVECGLLGILIHLLTTEKGEALENCVSAVSAITREYLPSCQEFMTHGGCEALAKMMYECTPTAMTRAAFLISFLVKYYPDAKEEFGHFNIVRPIIEEIKRRKPEDVEHLLNTLHILMSCDVRALEHAADPTLDLKKFLKKHMFLPEVYIEEDQVHHCKNMMQLLDSHVSEVVVENKLDR